MNEPGTPQPPIPPQPPQQPPPPQPPQPPPPQPPPPPAPAKKGISPLAWVLIVLGVIFVLMMGACVACGVLVTRTARDYAADFEANPMRAAAEMAVRFNPDLELVSSDNAAGTMTVRNKATGEEVTLDFSAIADGDFRWSTEEGEVSFRADEGGITTTGPEGESVRFGAVDPGEIPGWVLRYPGADVGEGGFIGQDAESISGMLSMTTSDEAEEVIDFYEEILREEGYEVTAHRTSGPAGITGGLVSGRTASPERSITAIVSADGGRTQISLQYSGARR